LAELLERVRVRELEREKEAEAEELGRQPVFESRGDELIE